jgi:hypothetical protein
LVNHSCNANASSFILGWCSDPNSSPVIVIRATKRIDQGEEVCIPYVNNYQPKQERVKELGFECLCSRCAQNSTEEKENLLTTLYNDLPFVKVRSYRIEVQSIINQIASELDFVYDPIYKQSLVISLLSLAKKSLLTVDQYFILLELFLKNCFLPNTSELEVSFPILMILTTGLLVLGHAIEPSQTSKMLNLQIATSQIFDSLFSQNDQGQTFYNFFIKPLIQSIGFKLMFRK